jgi:hypothetical protein
LVTFISQLTVTDSTQMGEGVVRYTILLALLFPVLFCSLAFCQDTQQDNPGLRHSIGSSLFLLGNIIPEDPVYAFQLDYGYRLTQKDVLIVEASA